MLTIYNFEITDDNVKESELLSWHINQAFTSDKVFLYKELLKDNVIIQIDGDELDICKLWFSNNIPNNLRVVRITGDISKNIVLNLHNQFRK